MKKTVLLLTILLISTAACGSKQEKIKIAMWAENIPQEIYDDFEKETGIKIVEEPISSNEEIYTKVKASGQNYDIVTPSLDYATILMNEGLLSQIDKSQIPNITNVDENILKHVTAIDKNHEYIMPFAFGPTVIAYDTTKVSNNVQGFEIYSNTNYAGKMMLLNDMREVMSGAFAQLGYPIDTTNETALKEVEALLRQWKGNILRFDADSYRLAYANGEVDVVHGYPESLLQELTEEKLANTKFLIPNKGGMMWVDNFLVLKDAPNKEGALKFINYIHRPEVYAKLVDYLGSLSLNKAARSLTSSKPVIQYSELGKAQMLLALDPEVLKVHARVWENVQAQ